MNTLTHILIGTAVVSRPRLTLGLLLAAFAGAVFPDIAILAMVIWEINVMGISESEMWGQAYFREPWVTYRGITNSFFIFGALFLVAWRLRWPLIMAFCASMLLHFLGTFSCIMMTAIPIFGPCQNAFFIPLYPIGIRVILACGGQVLKWFWRWVFLPIFGEGNSACGFGSIQELWWLYFG